MILLTRQIAAQPPRRCKIRVDDRPNPELLDARVGTVDTARRDVYTQANRWSRPF
jgi:hypothetical protein